MKVLLYTEGESLIEKSGLGKSIRHQMRSLELAGVEYTLDSENDDFDIFHVNTYFPKSYLMAKAYRKEGKAIVYHAHSTEEDFRNSFLLSNQLSPLLKKWIKECYSLGDIIITPTPYSKDLLEGYGLEPPIYAISNGIELDSFKKIEGARQIFCQKYGYDEDDKIIMGIGLYLRRKGIVDFVELAKRMPQYKFIWFGYSNPITSTLDVQQAVKTELSNLNFAGYVENKDIILALQACDLYVFPTYEETEGIPAIEACAAGADFIVRDIPVFDTWLENGLNCYKAINVDDFEKKINDFLKRRLPSLKDKAYKVAEERDLARIGQKLKSAYKHAMRLRDLRVK